MAWKSRLNLFLAPGEARMSRLILLALFLTATPLFGQSADLPPLELPAHSPSGFLLDRVVDMAHLEDLDGTAKAPTVDARRWRQVVHQLARAADVRPDWPAVQDLRSRGHGPEVPLALVFTDFHRLNQAGGLEKHRVLAFAPLASRAFHGAALELHLDPGHILRGQGVDFRRLELDAGDGLGWRDLTANKPLPVAYATPGVKNLTLRATLADGELLLARSSLDVVALDTPEPDQTWAITATHTYQGTAGSGQAYVMLAPGHTTLTRPVVVVEGFDLDNTMDWPVLYDLLNQENLLEDLRAQGRDAVVLDFTEATDPIQRNAFVLTELLAQVRATAGQETPLVVVGASMGGLVTRYALAWLENQGLEHGCRTFISFDSPQNGANIPLGLQYWLDFFKGESAEAEFLLSRLNTAAARQMLLYHYTDPPSSLPAADPLFAQLRDDLAGLGDWPAQPRLVAVANGSGLGQDQGFAAGEQLIRYEYRSLLVDIDGNVWAVPGPTAQVIFDGMLNLIWPLPDTNRTVTVQQGLPWDSAPGGLRYSLAQMDTTAVPYGDIEALHDAHCFVPTISALGLGVSDPFFDVAGAGDLTVLSPFDQLYWPAANQEHIAITLQNKAWFLDEIRRAVSAAAPGSPVAAAPRVGPAVPNPFNPATTIRFQLQGPGTVDLTVHDLRGQVVRRLVQGQAMPQGPHGVRWDGRDQEARPVAAGVYLYRLRVDGWEGSGRLTLVK